MLEPHFKKYLYIHIILIEGCKERYYIKRLNIEMNQIERKIKYLII